MQINRDYNEEPFTLAPDHFFFQNKAYGKESVVKHKYIESPYLSDSNKSAP